MVTIEMVFPMLRNPNLHVYLLIFLLRLQLAVCQEEPKNSPCSLIIGIASSAQKCMFQSQGKQNKGIGLGLLDQSRLPCMVKCVMADRGFLNAEGKLRMSGMESMRGGIPDVMSDKIKPEDLLPCIEIAATFDGTKCSPYVQFVQCILGVFMGGMDPASLASGALGGAGGGAGGSGECLNGIPGARQLMGMFQSGIGGNGGGTNGLIKGLRDRVLGRVGGGRSRII